MKRNVTNFKYVRASGGWRAGRETLEGKQSITSCAGLQQWAVHRLWTMQKKDGYWLRRKYHFSRVRETGAEFSEGHNRKTHGDDYNCVKARERKNTWVVAQNTPAPPWHHSICVASWLNQKYLGQISPLRATGPSALWSSSREPALGTSSCCFVRWSWMSASPYVGGFSGMESIYWP